MKKYYASIFFTLLTCSFALAQDTMDDFKKHFKNKSIDDIKELLVKQNKELASMIKLSSLSIKLTAGDSKSGEISTTEKFSDEPKAKITNAFNKKFDKLYFGSQIVYPNTMLGIDYSLRSLKYSVDDYDDYKFPDPTLKLKKIYFKNGKTTTLDQTIVGREGDMADQIKGTNFIDSVELEATYYYPERMSFVTLNVKNPSQTVKDGKIILVELKGNGVDLKISPAVKEQIIKIEGINSKGEALTQSSSSSSSMTSNFSTAYLQSLYDASENVIAKINKQQFKNTDELIADLFKNLPTEDQEKPEQFVNASYSFRGAITSVNVYFKPTGAVQNYTFTLKNKAELTDGLSVAENKKGLYGLLDESGKWLIEPIYERLSWYKGNYYMADVAADGYRNIFWLDKSSKKLVPFKYRFYRTEPYFDKYYTIEDGVNGPKGLVDMNSNEVLIQPVNDNIFKSDNFIIVTNDRKDVLLDKNLKQVMKFDDNNYKIQGDFIFVTKPYTKKEKFGSFIHLSGTDDIYNNQAKKINREDYVIDTFDKFGKDSLLLVQNQAGKKMFINTKGDVAIDASKYKDVAFFSNGLAAVKSMKGNWGYINVKGEVVIPMMYQEAKNFSSISALVQTENGYQLIDRNNKPIKKFSDGFSSMYVAKDAETLTYTNYDGKTYGSKGEVIPRK